MKYKLPNKFKDIPLNIYRKGITQRVIKSSKILTKKDNFFPKRYLTNGYILKTDCNQIFINGLLIKSN